MSGGQDPSDPFNQAMQSGKPSNTHLIFRGKWGEVGRHQLDFYSIGAGHLLCCEMAIEIERLREELAKPQAIKEP